MSRSLGSCLLGSLLLAGAPLARPLGPPLPATLETSGAGDFDPTGTRAPVAASPDTFWIADWTFDGPNDGCDESGWTAQDGYVHNDGSNFWSVGTRYAGQGHVVGHAAELRRHDLCWSHDGYGNAWDYAAVLRYRGAGSRLSFAFLSDSEPTYDFVTVEADSLCESNARAAAMSPPGEPAAFRKRLFSTSGPNLDGRVVDLGLPDFGLPDSVHCVYIRFVSDGGFSDEDGEYPSSIGAGLVLDDLVVAGGTLHYTEDFEGGGSDPPITLVNAAAAAPFGTFARLVHHPVDTDPLAEDPTCAWVFYDPAWQCAPELACVRPATDNRISSPWVALRGSGKVTLSFRACQNLVVGQPCTTWFLCVRSRVRVPNTDTPAPGDSIDCATAWSSSSFNTGSGWGTGVLDVTSWLVPQARAMQVGFRVAPGPRIGPLPPQGCSPTSGPYFDRVRIGRQNPPTDVSPGDGISMPSPSLLHQNVPNPFNPRTTIRFDLARSGHVTLEVLDVAGRRVRGLIEADLAAGGMHAVTWDGTDDAGRRVPSGVYVARLRTAANLTAARRLVLLK